MKRLITIERLGALAIVIAFGTMTTSFADDVSSVATKAETCCAAPSADVAKSDEASETGAWVSETLRNATDPTNGEASSADFFMPYADDEASVYGRIHFSSAASLESAKAHDKKALYIKAYLTRANGTQAAYGEPRLKLGNTFCPVSGVGPKGDRKLTLDKDASVNCAAGMCSLGDGFKVNYNAVQIGTCCPSCKKILAKNPEKFLSNVQPEIDKALKFPESLPFEKETD